MILSNRFSPALARRLGMRLAAYLRAGTFVVGRDARRGSAELAAAVVVGACDAGAQVVDIGEVSTPQFQWAIRSQEGVGGLMVTASHLPEPNNGFKAIARHGDVVEVLGGDRLRQILDMSEQTRTGGNHTTHDVLEGYAAAVAYAAGWQGGTALRASVDAPVAVKRVLERLGPIAPDAELGARCDTDGDRIVFYVDGQAIPADDIFLLLVDHLHLSPVVFDLRFSRTVRERLDQQGVSYAISRVGRLYLSLAMRERGAALGAEISGHYYWRAMGGMESPELTLLQVLKICNGEVKKLQELLQPYDRYARSEEINIPVRDRKQAASIMQRVEQHYAECSLDKRDGLTVDCWNIEAGFWFNIRPSHTEPVLRLVVESKKKDLLDRRVREVRELVG
jgi:phosphomannomutase